MSVFRALGFGMCILVLQLMIPLIFAQLESTIIAFLRAGEISANVGSQIAGTSGSLSHPPEPLVLPRTATIVH